MESILLLLENSTLNISDSSQLWLIADEERSKIISHKWRSCIFIFHSYYPRKKNLSCNRGVKIYDLDKSKDMNGSSWGEITRHKMLNLKGILRNNVFLWATKWKTKNNVQFVVKKIHLSLIKEQLFKTGLLVSPIAPLLISCHTCYCYIS